MNSARTKASHGSVSVLVLACAILGSACDKLPKLAGNYAGREQARSKVAAIAAAGGDPWVEAAPEVTITVTTEHSDSARVDVIVRGFARCRGEAVRTADSHPGWTRLTLPPTACTYWAEFGAPACPMRASGPILIRGNQHDGAFITIPAANAGDRASPLCHDALVRGVDLQVTMGLAESDPQFVNHLPQPRSE